MQKAADLSGLGAQMFQYELLTRRDWALVACLTIIFACVLGVGGLRANAIPAQT